MEDTATSAVYAIRAICAADILNGKAPIPYTDRSTWATIQQDCPTLQKVFALKRQGSGLRKKDTLERDVKRYLQHSTISADGMLLVSIREEQFCPVVERVVIPRAVAHG